MLGFLTKCAREYGDIVPLRLGHKRVIFISHPSHIEHVLVTSNQNFTKSYIVRLLRPVLGDGLLISEGEFWRRQRRLAQPAFHRGRIAAYAEIMVVYAEQMLSGWQDGEIRDIHAEMMQLTSRIVAKTLFDAEITSDAHDVGDAIAIVMENFSARRESMFPLPTSIPTPANLRLRRAIRRFDEIVYGFIDQRRESAQDHGDLLSMLLQVRDEDDGSRMTDKQLRDEAVTLFLAGHETTANSLSWAWYLVSQHLDVGTKLIAELRAVLGERFPTVEDLPNLKYTERIILETMRLYPPAYLLSREAVHEFDLGSFRLPAGTTLLISQWVTQRDSRFFEDPEEFSPDRWASDLAKQLPKCAYFPFGMGPRTCIGNSFAMMESMLLLATVAQRFRFTIVPHHPVKPWTSITLRPKFGIKVQLSKR
jgi:cytochrome P450